LTWHAHRHDHEYGGRVQRNEMAAAEQNNEGAFVPIMRLSATACRKEATVSKLNLIFSDDFFKGLRLL
jgi:hypothetical protein